MGKASATIVTALRLRTKTEDLGVRGPFSCTNCCKQYFTNRPKGEGEKFCGRECAFEFKRGPNHHRYLAPDLRKNYHPREQRQCVVCSKRIPRGKCCSDQCRAEHKRRESRQWSKQRKPIKTRLCSWCSSEFTPAYGDKRRHYCSKAFTTELPDTL